MLGEFFSLLTQLYTMSKLRVFQGDFPEYANFLTPAGELVVFYKGYTSTEDDAVANFVRTLPKVKEVIVTKDLKVPAPPERKRNQSWQSVNFKENPTTVSHIDLLQRAVANSKATPQAAESSSTTGE